MELPEESELLRIYIGEKDKVGHITLYEAIVEEVRKRGMAGATVLRGIISFGKSSRIHTSKILRLSEDLPIIIEIIDKTERIEEFLPVLDTMMGNGLVTREKVQVLVYRHNKTGKPVNDPR